MQKIIPNLWFNKNAEEAVNFYLSVFKDGRLLAITHYTEVGYDQHRMEAGSIMTIDFELAGHRFTAINGGPAFQFTPAISLMIFCHNQDEVDYYWERLSAVPEAEQCGWLKDKYGLSWQVVPAEMDEIFRTTDVEKFNRAMEAMLKMKKLDLAEFRKAVGK